VLGSGRFAHYRGKWLEVPHTIVEGKDQRVERHISNTVPCIVYTCPPA